MKASTRLSSALKALKVLLFRVVCCLPKQKYPLCVPLCLCMFQCGSADQGSHSGRLSYTTCTMHVTNSQPLTRTCTRTHLPLPLVSMQFLADPHPTAFPLSLFSKLNRKQWQLQMEGPESVCVWGGTLQRSKVICCCCCLFVGLFMFCLLNQWPFNKYIQLFRANATWRITITRIHRNVLL